MSKEDFKPFVVYSNWCYKDQLDGRDLVDGERVIVQWPSLREEEFTVYVTHRSEPILDHGVETSISHRRAWVQVQYEGHRTLIRLGDSGLKGRRV